MIHPIHGGSVVSALPLFFVSGMLFYIYFLRQRIAILIGYHFDYNSEI